MFSGNWFDPATIIALHDSEHGRGLAIIGLDSGMRHCEGDTWPGRKYVGKLLTTHSHVVVTYLSFGLPHLLTTLA